VTVFWSGTWRRCGGSGVHNCEGMTGCSDTVRLVQMQRTAARMVSGLPTIWTQLREAADGRSERGAIQGNRAS
jgi:hypothetical protein